MWIDAGQGTVTRPPSDGERTDPWITDPWINGHQQLNTPRPCRAQLGPVDSSACAFVLTDPAGYELGAYASRPLG